MFFSPWQLYLGYSNSPLPSNSLLTWCEVNGYSWKHLHKKFCILNLTHAGYNCSPTVVTQPNPLPFSVNVSCTISDDSERNCGLFLSFPEGPNTHAHLYDSAFASQSAQKTLILQYSSSSLPPYQVPVAVLPTHKNNFIHMHRYFKADIIQWNVIRKGRSTRSSTSQCITRSDASYNFQMNG